MGKSAYSTVAAHNDHYLTMTPPSRHPPAEIMDLLMLCDVEIFTSDGYKATRWILRRHGFNSGHGNAISDPQDKDAWRAAIINLLTRQT